MPTSFAITAAKQTVKLDSDLKGEVSFTVTNTSDRPLRGQLRVRPLDQSKLQWFTLSGDTEREFTAKGTQQVTVRIQAPSGIDPDRYNFRLDAASTINPDDDFTEGQTVAIEVPVIGKPPPFPWWIVAVAAAVLVLGVGIWVVMHGNKKVTPPPVAKVSVPDVTSMTFADARKALTDVGLKASLAAGSNSATTAAVTAESPRQGSSVDPGVTITLTTQTGPKIIVAKPFETRPVETRSVESTLLEHKKK